MAIGTLLVARRIQITTSRLVASWLDFRTGMYPMGSTSQLARPCH